LQTREEHFKSPGLTFTLSIDEDCDEGVSSPLSIGVPERKVYLDGPQKVKSEHAKIFHKTGSLSQDSFGASYGRQHIEKHPLRRSKNPPIKVQKSHDEKTWRGVSRLKDEGMQRKSASLPSGSKPPGSPRSHSRKSQTASEVASHILMDMVDVHFRNFQIELSTKPQHWLESYKDKHWNEVTFHTNDVDESEKNRRNKVWDLFHTELVFFTTQLQPLKLVFRNFLVFLQQQSPPLFKDVNVFRIFGNLDDVYDLSIQVAMDLLKLFKLKSGSDVAKPNDVVSTFKMFGHKFNPVYQTYGLNFESSKEYRETLYLQPLFTKYMKLAASDPMCKRLKLDDFLLAPVKHLAHYPMLLEKIVKYTPGASTKSLLQSALHAFKVSLKELESNMDDYKHILRLNEIQKTLHWPTVDVMETGSYIPQILRFKISEQPCERLIVSGHQTILHEGKLKLIGTKGQTTKKLHAMLFQNFLLLTEAVKLHSQRRMSVYKQPFSLSEMSVYDIPASELKRSFACLLHNKFNQHVSLLVFQAEANEGRDIWLRKLRSAIEDSKLS
jgi:hypothetical protein